MAVKKQYLDKISKKDLPWNDLPRYIKYYKFNSTQKQDVAANHKIKQKLSKISKN